MIVGERDKGKRERERGSNLWGIVSDSNEKREDTDTMGLKVRGCAGGGGTEREK